MRQREGVLWNFRDFWGLISPRWDQKLIWPEQYAYCSAAIKDGGFSEDLNKVFSSHQKDFAVRQKSAEIFIVQCDFTGKIIHPSSVTNFRAFQGSQTHTGKTRQCVWKNKNFEIRNDITFRECASQQCSNLIDRKRCIFLRIMLEKSPYYRHFTREIAVSENAVLLFLTRFSIDPLSVLKSSINSKVQWTSLNSALEMW